MECHLACRAAVYGNEPDVVVPASVGYIGHHLPVWRNGGLKVVSGVGGKF